MPSSGFDIITEPAGVIEEALMGGAGVEKVREDLAELVELCSQVRSPLPAAGSES